MRWSKLFVQPELPHVVEKNVLWLEIPVDDVETVQMFKCAQMLGGVGLSAMLVELTLALKVVKKLAAINYSACEMR